MRPPFGSSFKRERSDDLRTNRRIRVPEVRLIDEEGGQRGVVATHEAMRMAESAGLDLVEISPTSRPPVCKIMDYGKYKYEQAKRKHEQKKKQTVVVIKEIKMRPGTDEHDFQTKLRHIKRFLEEGDKVKLTIRFRGREMAHMDLGHERMKRVIEEVKGLGEAENFPRMEERQLFMMLAPLKKKLSPAEIQQAKEREQKQKEKQAQKQKEAQEQKQE